jgi:hypothetical protein
MLFERWVDTRSRNLAWGRFAVPHTERSSGALLAFSMPHSTAKQGSESKRNEMNVPGDGVEVLGSGVGTTARNHGEDDIDRDRPRAVLRREARLAQSRPRVRS